MEGTAECIAIAAKEQRPKKPRVLMPLDNNTVDGEQPQGDLTEYEMQRLERIKHNKQRMEALGLVDAVSDLRATYQQQQPKRVLKTSKPRAAAKPIQPTRRSKRGMSNGTDGEDASAPAEEPAPALLTLEEYFKANNIDYSSAIRAEGFRGWVNPTVREMYGIATNAQEAWDSQGGGTFSRKIDKKAIPAAAKAKGWSDAKAIASTQLLKNPNQYFYRHTAPHLPQAQGDWSDEEHELFVATMREHGVGDKWGLFASYIPNRVGYQCSAYYRDVIVPSGLVLDDHYRLTQGGKAQHVG